MQVSIIMVTMNRKAKALRSLKAVLKQTVKPKEVIVIDSSHDNSLGKDGRKLLSRSKIKFVYIHKKVTMPKARNIGIKKSGTSDILLFIDDDILLQPDYIEKLFIFYEHHPNAAGASGYLCDGNRFLIERWSKFPYVPSLKKPFKISNIFGSNMSFRKKIFKKFMFYEGLHGYYAEDDEFSARISREYDLYLIPYVKCIHKHTPTGGARLDPFTDFNTMIFNRYYVYRKRKKTIFNFFHYIFSDSLILLRILLYHKNKARAFSGAFRGYRRILNNIFNYDITEELNKL